MRRPASIGRLFGLTFVLALGGILFSTRGAFTDSLVAASSLGALNSNDSVAWSQLGADGTSLSSTIHANSAGAIAITGTLAADGSLASVVCPASPCSWGSPGSAGFGAGDTVIWTSDTANGGTGPLKLAFNTSVKGAGAFIQADGPGQFTAKIQAFNGAASLGSFTATSDTNGNAVFLGVVDNTAAHITSVVYSLTACVGVCSDFAIDTLFINSGSGPTPTATATSTGGATTTHTATPTPGPTAVPTTSMAGVPAQINFGNMDASSASKPRKASITNKGAISAIIGTVSAPSGFSIAAGTDLCSNHTVLPKKSCAMMLQFLPASPGPFSGSLSVPYNGIPATVGLSGNGTVVSVKGPASVVFAPVAAGSTGAQKLVAISNLSKTATVQMGATPNLSGPFIKGSTDTCSNASIKPRGKCMIGLELMPPPGLAKGTPLPGSLGFDFTYGSNSGSVPTITLTGKVK